MLDHRDHLAHRQHDAAQRDQVFAQLKCPALQVCPGRPVEQVVLQTLDAVIESLDRVEVTVDDHIEQPVHERADPVLLTAELVESA